MPHLARQFLQVLLIIAGIGWVYRQVRKPSGPLGKRMLRVMNISHAAMTDWGLQFLPVRPNDTLLDIGCGGGRTVKRLTELSPEGVVHGVDYSPASVAASRAMNSAAIALGRAEIQLASVAQLPYPDRTFDAAVAVETHYYWPNLVENTREVCRVLKPGGTFALIAETYRGGRLNVLYGVAMRLLSAAYLTDAEHVDFFIQAGFTEVSTKHLPGKGWICVTGRRPI